MNDILHWSGAAWLHAAFVALTMLGLGLEGMGSDEEPLHAEAESQVGWARFCAHAEVERQTERNREGKRNSCLPTLCPYRTA